MKSNEASKQANLVPLGKIKVPSTNSQLYPLRPQDTVDALDSMIGNLESDLNRQGVSTVSKGTCEHCNKPIMGRVITAIGATWHPEHFRCTKCGSELGEKTFYQRDGLAYCENDYHKLFSPQCAHCYQPIQDVSILWLQCIYNLQLYD